MAKQQQRKYTRFSSVKKKEKKEDKHDRGVEFFVHRDIVNTVMGCRPVSSRLITIHLRTAPFNIEIVQECALASDYDETK